MPDNLFRSRALRLFRTVSVLFYQSFYRHGLFALFRFLQKSGSPGVAFIQQQQADYPLFFFNVRFQIFPTKRRNYVHALFQYVFSQQSFVRTLAVYQLIQNLAYRARLIRFHKRGQAFIFLVVAANHRQRRIIIGGSELCKVCVDTADEAVQIAVLGSVECRKKHRIQKVRIHFGILRQFHKIIEISVRKAVATFLIWQSARLYVVYVAEAHYGSQIFIRAGLQQRGNENVRLFFRKRFIRKKFLSDLVQRNTVQSLFLQYVYIHISSYLTAIFKSYFKYFVAFASQRSFKSANSSDALPFKKPCASTIYIIRFC